MVAHLEKGTLMPLSLFTRRQHSPARDASPLPVPARHAARLPWELGGSTQQPTSREVCGGGAVTTKVAAAGPFHSGLALELEER